MQKIGNAAHINVQLIRVATDEHLWAESYNRKLDDIFAVEGEVATAIADQLNAKLTGSEKESLSIKPTSNPEAYDAYLRGLAFQGRLDSLHLDIRKSIDAFEEAARLDPQFALAWAQLVRQDSLAYTNFERTPQRREAAARQARVQPHRHEELERDLDAFAVSGPRSSDGGAHVVLVGGEVGHPLFGDPLREVLGHRLHLGRQRRPLGHHLRRRPALALTHLGLGPAVVDDVAAVDAQAGRVRLAVEDVLIGAADDAIGIFARAPAEIA